MTEAFGGGIVKAIESYSRFRSVDHHLVARRRSHAAMAFDSTGFESQIVVDGRIAFMRALLRSGLQDFDYVHLHSSIAGVARIFPSGVPMIYSPHALAAGQHSSAHVGALANRVERWLARSTYKFAAVSSGEVDEIDSLTGGSARVVHVPHAVGSKTPVGFKQRRPVVVALGRVCFQKGPDLVWDVPRRLMNALQSELDFLWIGGGDRDMCKLLEAGGWTVTGWLSHDEALEIVGQAVVLLHAARYEGLPLAVLEALAQGTPVVAKAIPAFRGIDGPTYYGAVNQAIRCLAELVENPQQWEISSTAGVRAVAREFSRTAQDRALADLYNVPVSAARQGAF